MPLKPGYKHSHGLNIPITTKGPTVEECLAKNYVACRQKYSADTPTNKRICAAISHKHCG